MDLGCKLWSLLPSVPWLRDGGVVGGGGGGGDVWRCWSSFLMNLTSSLQVVRLVAYYVRILLGNGSHQCLDSVRADVCSGAFHQ